MRTNDIKYLGLGLGIGAMIASGFILIIFLLPHASEASSLKSDSHSISIPSPMFQFTNTIAATQSPTNPPPAPPPSSPIPSNIEIMVERGDLAIVGPLEKNGVINLYQASLTFIAPTYAESKKMSVRVNQQRFSDPNSICGPLSIAILQSAGILGGQIIPHDFFLLNPDLGKDRKMIIQIFPKELYSDTRYRIKINKVDWTSQPLMPGDFVYIYMGKEGNFEHMLVVNRVDKSGRAYSVTNYNTDQGFVINEVLLYDPNDPTAGIFAQWTKREKQLLGSTGFAGYEVWRLKETQE